MPEYHLDVHDDHDTWRKLDSFTQGYIEAMFFTETSPAFSFSDIEKDREAWLDAEREGQSDGTIPSDATFADLAPESLASIIADCRKFQEQHDVSLQCAYSRGGSKGYYDSEDAGRDFWYTRNGHGVGFWDRGLDEVGAKLSEVCGHGTAFSNRDVYLGDDNKVHLS